MPSSFVFYSKPFLLRICLFVMTLSGLLLTGCHFTGSGRVPPPSSHYSKGGVKGTKPYTIRGKTYYPLISAQGFVEEGIASWYGKDFHGKKTANGELYNMYGMTAAHKTLPLGTTVRVTNKGNGRSIVVRVNDRGPFVDDRIIDLTKTGAQKLGMIAAGTARVRIEALSGGSSSTNTLANNNSSSLSKAFTSNKSEYSPSMSASNTNRQFFIQTGAFSTRSNANSALNILKNQGIQGRVVQPSENGMWRVQAGPYSTENQVESAKKSIQGFVVIE